MKLTRRKLAAALVAAPAAVPRPAAAQAAQAGDELKSKRDLMRANAAAVANYSIPMATEPAFQFKT